ncbi:MAG: polyketide synthase dehydratase domain-containing protein, partial [Gammaproteobacteria bacterium]|nr:polyketide synthase dehydratase domain-containing protein [Gammaproteobacteria bacterium]
AVIAPEALGVDYWKEQLRGTLRFDAAFDTLASEDIDAFVEIGSGTTLLKLARRRLTETPAHYLASLEAGVDDWQTMVGALATLYASGAEIDWQSVDRGYAGEMLRLPTYAFDRKRHWIDVPPAPPASRAASGVLETGHPLLGSQLRSPLDAIQFESRLGVIQHPWLSDHIVFDRLVVPATAYLEMLLSAAGRATNGSVDLEDVFIHAPIIVDPGGETTVQIIVESAEEAGRLRIVTPATSAIGEDAWTEHVSARFRLSTADAEQGGLPDVEAVAGRCADAVDLDAHYRDMAETGVDFGPAFRTVDRMRRGDNESIGWVSAPGAKQGAEPSGFWLHPAQLDGCLQVAREALPESVREDRDAALIPMRLAGVKVYGPGSATVVSHATLDKSSDTADSFELNIEIRDIDGRRIADLHGLRLARVDRKQLDAEQPDRKVGDLYELEWRNQALVEPSATSAVVRNWLVFEYGNALMADCARALRAAGERVWSVSSGVSSESSGDDYSIRVDNADDFRRLIDVTVGDSSGSCVILHAGGSAPPGVECDVDTLRECHEHYLQSLLHLAQALESRSADVERLVVITSGSQGKSSLAGIAGAAAWGLVRVMQTELPGMDSLLLDTHDRDLAAQQLMSEVRAAQPENQVMYRNGERHVARLIRAAEDQHESASQLVLKSPGILDSLELCPMRMP